MCFVFPRHLKTSTIILPADPNNLAQAGMAVENGRRYERHYATRTAYHEDRPALT
jgi:hypothetical protein